MNESKRTETGNAARITQQKINELCSCKKTRNFAWDKKPAENFGEVSDLKSGLFFWTNTGQKRGGKAVYVLTKNRKKSRVFLVFLEPGGKDYTVYKTKFSIVSPLKLCYTV